MPRYVSPSPTRPRSRSRNNKASRSRSRSRSRSKSASRKSVSESIKEASLVKTSLVFLGSIAAATFCAHKFWPKGVTYGDKEAWETAEIAEMKRVKKNLQEERRAGRKGGSYDDEERDRDRDRDRGDRRRYSDRDGRRRSYYYADEGSARGGDRDERYERSSDRERRDRDPERERYYYSDSGRYAEPERYSERGSEPSTSRDRYIEDIDRRGSRREAYYPPAPQRYPVEAYANRAPSTRSRQSSRERKKVKNDGKNDTRQPGRYNDDEPEYLYGAAWDGGQGGRAGSHDRGGVSADRGAGRSMSRDSGDS